MPGFIQKAVEPSRRFSPLRTVSVRLGAAALLGLAAIPAAGRAQDVTIVNRASAVFVAGGTQGSATAEAAVSIGRIAAVRLVPPQSVTALPGAQQVFAHQLTNLGTAGDNFRLEVSAPAGWEYQIYMDLDGDGVLGPADKPVSGALFLARGASVSLLLVVTVPSNAADATDITVEVRAISTNDPSISDTVRDRITVRRTSAALGIIKNVNAAEAVAGDTLTYTISYSNTGDATAPQATLADLLPSGLRFLSGSLRLDGAALTDAVDGDAASVERTDDGRDRFTIRIGDILPKASGLVTMKAVVIAAAEGVLLNVASLEAADISLESNVARTTILVPQLRLTKELVSSSDILAGDEATFRISWANASPSASIRDVFLTDTIPAPLEFVKADGNPTVAGRIVTWSLGTLSPSQAGSVTLTTRAATAWEGEVVNKAVIRGSNVVAVSASAAALRITNIVGQRLEIAKRAGVLEASLGDAIPYIVTVRNAGVGALSDIVIDDRLPEGVEFVTGRLTGADSASANGRDVRIWIAGPLASGEERNVRYVVSLIAPGSATSLANMVTAEAEGGRVKSDTASATVQIRRGFALQSRTLLGKVWLDIDENGRQSADEPGVPGVEIWSEDGEVVLTDAEGRYSFRNLRLGSHTFRLDTLGLPQNARLAKGTNVTARVRMDGWTTPRADFRIVPGIIGVRVASTDMVVAPGSGKDLVASRRTDADTTGVKPVRVAPLRSEADRASEAASAFVRGPVVRFFAPTDGIVVTDNRLFAGVDGEPGAIVKLYNDSAMIAEAELRPDGKWDFIGVEVPSGPSSLRVSMTNSFGNDMWDSVRIHRTGGVAQFAASGIVATLRAESQDIETIAVRVLDSWGVPVPGAVVTVNIEDATITATDNDRTSVGTQLKANADGVLRVPVRAGNRVGPVALELSTGRMKGRVQVRILPSVRSFIAAGAGQVGIGAAPQDFAALTMKGAIGKESSVSVSYDSRRGSAEDDFFGRGYDPLEEGRYPAIGDASERRVLSASTQRLSARVEHGFDWLELGDIETRDFSGEGRLSTYSRSLTGVGAKVSTGALTWRAFGSLTDQVLSQVQARGNGSSGPYAFGSRIRPGTDKLAVEVRSAENASIVIAREELERFRDYQIDYSTGEVLLQRPLASMDPSGNPLFLVAILERRSGGESRMVVGGRIDLDAGRLLNTRVSDSIRVFVLGVRDGGDESSQTRRNDLVGGGLRLQKGLFHIGAEMLRVASFDSSANAARAVAGIALPRGLGGVEAEWTRVGAGFVPGLDPRLSGATEDLRITGTLRLSDASTLRITDSRQKFDAFGVERHSTIIGSTTSVLGRQFSSEGVLSTDRSGLGSQRAGSTFMTGKVKLALSQKAALWVEGSHTLSTESGATPVLPRPDQVATGVTYTIFDGIQLESSQRWVGLDGDTSSYSVSSVKLRTESIFGGAVWAGVDRASSSSAINSATLGWKPQLALAGGWSMNGMLERRFGLNGAPLADPLRALPFPQIERNRWAFGLGTQWLPKDSVGRMSLNGEMRNDQVSSGQKVGFEAEAPMSEAAAFLVRSDWWKESRETGTETVMSRRDRSLLGVALRPASSNAFNVLAKVEWRRSTNPGMGTRFSGNGNDERLIAATDAILGMRAGTEVAGRYAVRMMVNNDPLVADSVSVRSLSHFVGGRAEQVLAGPLSARIDARFLSAGTGVQRWNAAPSALVTVGGRIDIEGGYRFGNLRDADFAAQGGKGFFATIGVRVTEGALTSAAGFWRERIARDSDGR